MSLSHPDIPPRSLPFNDKKPFYVREVSKSPIQYKMVVPPLSRDVATIKQGFSRAFSPSGKASVGLGSGASWKDEYSRLADEIQVRHYSPKTLQTYRGWVQKFQAFTHSKGPELLSSNDVKEFLTLFGRKTKGIGYHAKSSF